MECSFRPGPHRGFPWAARQNRPAPGSASMLSSRRERVSEEKPMTRIDPWRMASKLRDTFGNDALLLAAMRADAFYAEGDMARFDAWRGIVRAINDLERSAESSDAVH